MKMKVLEKLCRLGRKQKLDNVESLRYVSNETNPDAHMYNREFIHALYNLKYIVFHAVQVESDELITCNLQKLIYMQSE